LTCKDRYISIDRSTTSRSGLYATDLPGVEISLLEGLTKEDQDDYLELWEMIYDRAWSNLVSDIEKKLQGKFYVNKKLIAQETSKFIDETNNESGMAGIKLEFDLPKYARIHVSKVDVFAQLAYNSPGLTIKFYDTDENGELLLETEAQENIEVGRNTIFIDHDFEVEKLFIAFDPGLFELRKTENVYFPLSGHGFSVNNKLNCMFPCAWGGEGSASQVKGGGINAHYTVECSIEKYVCENINLFKRAFWYRIGLELTVERRFGNRLNEFTTMTVERAEELQKFFNDQYTQDMDNTINPMRNSEDPYCFNCRKTVNSRVSLP
jgi:hypothetical protein